MYEWLIPDGYLPGGGSADLPGHEAVCLVNPLKRSVRVAFDVYFVDRPPILDVEYIIEAERSAHLGIGGPYRIPNLDIPEKTPFSMRVRCEEKIGVQYTRVWSFPDRLGLMTTIIPMT